MQVTTNEKVCIPKICLSGSQRMQEAVLPWYFCFKAFKCLSVWEPTNQIVEAKQQFSCVFSCYTLGLQASVLKAWT